MKRFLIALPLIVAAALGQPQTPINNVRFTGTMNGAPTGGSLDLSLVAVTGISGSGTVTAVSVTTANGISGTVATPNSTPAISLALAAITPTSVNGIVLSGSSTPTLAVTGTSSISGANTGDQTSVTGNAGTATALQTARAINGVSFNGTAAITVTAAAGTLTGTTLNSTVTASSLLSAAGGSFGTAAFTAAGDYEPALGNPSVTGYVLSSTTAGVRSWVAQSGGGGTPGGSDTQVQFNDGGSFGGDSGLVFNKTSNALTALGVITGSNLSGTNTGDQTSVTGNAGTATALETARNINGVSFDGTANITVTAAAGTLTGTVLASNVVTSSLTSAAGGSFGTAAFTAASAYVAANGAITGATKTKITYDTKGLVTAGADATTADIADSLNKRYVTDAQLVVIGNTSGTNTGDQTSVTGNAGTATALQTARNINGVSFDGTANITVTAAAGTLTGTTLNSSVVTSSLTTVGTIGTGAWQGTVVAGEFGGTGVANTSKTITLGGNLATSGAFGLTLTLTALTNVTLPTTGTLATLAGSEALTGKTYNGLTLTTTTGTLTLTNAKTFSVSNSLTLAGTDSTTMTFPGTSQTIVGLTATQQITAKQILHTAAHGTDDTWEGEGVTGLNAGATIAQWEAVYLGGSSTWLLADADGSSTYPARGLAVAAYVNTNAAVIVTKGTVRNDAWNWTPGGTIYLSATAGSLTQTPPSTSTHKVQQVGFALTADIAHFDFASGEFLTVQ